MTHLLILTYCKKALYNFIFVIINWLIKIVNYKQIKTTINDTKIVKVIKNMVVLH